MVKREFTFLSADGKTPVHAVEWKPEQPVRGVVQISHGVAEYVERYAPFARFLTGHGFAVVGNDHIGHGTSLATGAAPVYFDRWDDVVDDLKQTRDFAGESFPGVPHFLLGHSMGSYLLRSYLIRCPGTISGAVLVGTGQMGRVSIAYCRALALRESRRFGWERTSPAVNRLSFSKYNRIFSPTRTEYDWLSANAENVDRYIADPLCGGDSTLGLCREMLAAMRRLQLAGNLRKMDPSAPVLFLSGSMDPVGDCGKGVEKVFHSFQRAGVRDVSMKLYPGARHEILNDNCREEVFRDVLTWLEARMPVSAPQKV